MSLSYTQFTQTTGSQTAEVQFERPICSKNGALSKRSKSATSRQVWESSKPYLIFGHADAFSSPNTLPPINMERHMPSTFIIGWRVRCSYSKKSNPKACSFHQKKAFIWPNCFSSVPVHHAFTGNETALRNPLTAINVKTHSSVRRRA